MVKKVKGGKTYRSIVLVRGWKDLDPEYHEGERLNNEAMGK